MSAPDKLTRLMTDGRVPFSEDDLADKFSTEHVDDLRYCHDWGRWLEWTGTNWRVDRTVYVFDLVRDVCGRAAAQCNSNGKRLATAATIYAVERLARADRRHATISEQWDADPFALNTPGGTVDLRTGKTRPNSPEDYLTKRTAVMPGKDCPTWHEFLVRITKDDEDLIGFLRRVVGYSITGSTREHAMFFAYGRGANGKSVFCNTISGIMADYHRTAPADVFMASRTDRHPTELAGLQGARLVTATETEENRRWAESRIKALTGGDPISARYMRQDFFEFTPTFKLFVAGNHKPRLHTVDEAIRRRLHLIPFSVTIPKAERDPDLSEKLKTEWPGILGWAIKGAVEWHTNGLQPPAVVTDATLEYLAGEDLIAVWIEDRCYQEPGARTLASELHKNFKEWTETTGERSMSQRAFSTALDGHGFQKEKTRDGRYFLGLGL
ncbi:MAG: phage/plasmid primase, P4 family [Alphaproteobacteria bacterium]